MILKELAMSTGSLPEHNFLREASHSISEQNIRKTGQRLVILDYIHLLNQEF
jgi:hypothetical protein